VNEVLAEIRLGKKKVEEDDEASWKRREVYQ
jgi:hypothetical protein